MLGITDGKPIVPERLLLKPPPTERALSYTQLPIIALRCDLLHHESALGYEQTQTTP